MDLSITGADISGDDIGELFIDQQGIPNEVLEPVNLAKESSLPPSKTEKHSILINKQLAVEANEEGYYSNMGPKLN